MAFYLNCDSSDFEEDLVGGYIDKTLAITNVNKVLNSKDKFICMTRPRRFGKSIAADMLNAYYSKGANSKSIFDNLLISKEPSYLNHLNKHNVIYIDMTSFNSTSDDKRDFLVSINQSIFTELKESFSDCFDSNCNYMELPKAIQEIYKKTDEKFIFIIDEWDFVFRNFKDSNLLIDDYINWLRVLFKSNFGKKALSLVYMTGILPIKKVKTESVLNNFKEYSMLDAGEYAQYFGFTDQEVRQICKDYDIDYQTTKLWYDGYRLKSYEIYNPNSIYNLMRSKSFKSYWSQTGTLETVTDYIKFDFDGLRSTLIDLINGNTVVDLDTGTFKNDLVSFSCRDDVLVFLIHLGYLAYDEEKETVFVPNQEVRESLVNAVQSCEWPEYIEEYQKSKKLLIDVINSNCKNVETRLSEIRQDYTSILDYNSESAVKYAILTAFSAASEQFQKPFLEMPTGDGFADVVFLPKSRYIDLVPALIIEVKKDRTSKEALEQIKTKHYMQRVKQFAKSACLIGINYDSKTKFHNCLIERIKF